MVLQIEDQNKHRRKRFARVSRIPAQKIPVQRQTVLRTFFGVKLRRKNIIPRQRAAKSRTIPCLPCTVAQI
jgi:hypothetical protein